MCRPGPDDVYHFAAIVAINHPAILRDLLRHQTTELIEWDVVSNQAASAIDLILSRDNPISQPTDV